MSPLKLLLLIALSFVNFLAIQEPHQDDGDIIVWQKDRKLTWDDFKATNPVDSSAAYSCISIEMNPEEKFVIVIATFNKKKSWAKANGSNILLEHEQGHFNIAEIYARMIRKLINDQYLSKKDIDYSDIYHKMIDQENTCHNHYDSETSHSTISVAQKKWNKTIDSLLFSLKKYSNDTCIIN